MEFVDPAKPFVLLMGKFNNHLTDDKNLVAIYVDMYCRVNKKVYYMTYLR